MQFGERLEPIFAAHFPGLNPCSKFAIGPISIPKGRKMMVVFDSGGGEQTICSSEFKQRLREERMSAIQLTSPSDRTFLKR